MNEDISYAELMKRDEAPHGSTWGLFGADDRRGTVNRIGQDQVVSAASLVREGRAFGLDYPLDTFDPPLAATRNPPAQSVFSRHPAHRDESLHLYTQASSQVDGLRHRRHAVHGFYNGLNDGQVDDEQELGVDAWGDAGIVGRGILIDLEGYFLETGRALDHEQGVVFTLDDLRQAYQLTGLTPQAGDLAVFHTGWTSWYLHLDATEQQKVRDRKRFSGIDQDRDIIAWSWDHGFAGLFSDCYALEALPARSDSEFHDDLDHGMMHQELLALMGYPIGELWRLDHLAQHCRSTGRYEFMLSVKPLNMPGGVGSPCNALALM